MTLRILLALIGLVVLGVVGLSAYVRLTPLDPGRWHVDLAHGDPPAAGNCLENLAVLANGAQSVCDLAGNPAEILARLDAVAMATPRTTRLAGSAEAGRITWVARTRIMGYPDVITAQTTATATGARLDILSRQVYGRGDWGVNAARLKLWLSPF